jgi:hypothetical protein
MIQLTSSIQSYLPITAAPIKSSYRLTQDQGNLALHGRHTLTNELLITGYGGGGISLAEQLQFSSVNCFERGASAYSMLM